MTAGGFSQAALEDAVNISRQYGIPLVWADLKPVLPARKNAPATFTVAAMPPP
jgi:hypothetical protein